MRRAPPPPVDPLTGFCLHRRRAASVRASSRARETTHESDECVRVQVPDYQTKDARVSKLRGMMSRKRETTLPLSGARRCRFPGTLSCPGRCQPSQLSNHARTGVSSRALSTSSHRRFHTVDLGSIRLVTPCAGCPSRRTSISVTREHALVSRSAVPGRVPVDHPRDPGRRAHAFTHGLSRSTLMPCSIHFHHGGTTPSAPTGFLPWRTVICFWAIVPEVFFPVWMAAIHAGPCALSVGGRENPSWCLRRRDGGSSPVWAAVWGCGRRPPNVAPHWQSAFLYLPTNGLVLSFSTTTGLIWFFLCPLAPWEVPVPLVPFVPFLSFSLFPSFLPVPRSAVRERRR